MRLCAGFVVQIQSREHALDNADYTAPTLQREPYAFFSSGICLALKYVNREVGNDHTDHLFDVCIVRSCQKRAT